jgi:two-component system NtrC family sensor kinase
MGAGPAPRSLQREVLASLGLVMVLSTALLGGVLLAHEERTLRELLGRALVAEAHGPPAAGRAFVVGTRWWWVSPDGRVEPRGPFAGAAIDADTRTLADRVRREGRALLVPGPFWDSMRFGVPVDSRGRVAVARLPAEASVRLRVIPLALLGTFLLADGAIFTALGAYLLRRRVVLPLQKLAAVARALAAGDAAVRAPLEGTAETAALGAAMNEMTEALAARTGALEKAVIELRGANRELRQARKGLARADRLAAVGRLAAGVAHEVGNPIGAVLALVDLAGRDPGLGPEARGHLERAGREGVRVRTILRQLLDFARPPRPSPGPVDLVAAAEQAVALVRAQRRYGAVEFVVAPAPDAPTARGDVSVVAQILLNLLLNAADATAGRETARVLVRVRPGGAERRLADDPTAPAPVRRRPDAVECEVADDGAGIDPADRERIFDPFFTTKPPGEGTGLGLANAALLAEELDGVLELADPPEGFRTAFRLRLPAWEPGCGVEAGAEARGGAPQAASGCAADCAAGAVAAPAPGDQSSSGTPR